MFDRTEVQPLGCVRRYHRRTVAIYGEGLGRTEARTASDALELFGLRPAWMRDGLCREHPEVSFFPALGESSEPAKAVCARCLVRDACLQFALEHTSETACGAARRRESGRR